jgi:hypothetical protein
MMATVAVVAVGLAVFPFREDRLSIDSVTGSTMDETYWYLLRTRQTVQRSALEDWIIRNDGHYSPNWYCYSSRTQTIFGIGRGCRMAPEIYTLRAGDLNDRFVSSATDREIATFVHVMRTGTQDQQSEAVENVCGSIVENRQLR